MDSSLEGIIGQVGTLGAPLAVIVWVVHRMLAKMIPDMLAQFSHDLQSVMTKIEAQMSADRDASRVATEKIVAAITANTAAVARHDGIVQGCAVRQHNGQSGPAGAA